MKKLTLILWLLLSTTICTFAYDFRSGDLCYSTTSDSTVVVTKPRDSGTYSGLTSVVIPESVTYNGTTYRVTSIGDDAFWDCSSLTSIAIPSGVISIGYGAFGDCGELTSVVWNAKNYADFAYNSTPFYSANWDLLPQITSFVFGDSVQYIPAYICAGMNNLTSVTIGNSVTSIGEEAFSGCSGLTSITIPNSVTSIGERAFYDVFNIVYFGSAIGAPWGAKNINLYADDYFVYSDSTKTTLLRCSRSATGDIAIPNSVTSIGDSAFYDCSGLTSVTIPNSVTSIGNSAFSGCSGLTSIAIPNNVTSIGRSAFSGCSGLTSITIPNSVTTIGDWAFCGCSGLTSITIPNSVTSIGEDAFFGCTGLTSISIGDGVTTIGGSAFQYCSGLMSVTIPNSVTSIGSGAFRSCTGLTSITIGNNVTTIEDHVFDGCTSLMSIVWNAKYCSDFTSSNTPFYYYDSRESSNNFDLNSQITSFAFGDCVQHIPAYICDGMKNLTSVTIGNSATSIGDYAFRDCSSLKSITVPNSVVLIGVCVFSGCRGLTSVTIPQDVMSIGTNSFYNCTSLTHVAWNALDYTQKNPFYYDQANFYGSKYKNFDLRKQITSFVCSDSVYAITPGICYQMTNLDTLACPIMALESENTNMENYPKALKYIKLLNGELTETIQSILSTGSKTIRTLDLGGVSNTEIPDEAFREFYKMDTLVLPSQLTKIPYKAVSECVALQSIVVPEGVTDIEYGAFSGCSGLQTLSLPSTLQSIADNGFASCSALKEMRVHAQTPPTVYANTFSGVKRTIPVYVPQSAYNDYTAAEVWKEFLIQGISDAVENIPSNDTRNQGVHKVLRDGQIYILRGNKTYTLTGEEVK